MNTSNITVLNNFSGSSIGEWQLEGNTLTLQLAQEPIVHADYEAHNYNVHFTFGLKNNTKSIQTIKIIIQTDMQHITPNTIYLSDSSWNITDRGISTVQALDEGYTFPVTLPPSSCTYLSNTMWHSLDYIEDEFSEYSNNQKIRTLTYGRSYDNHPLQAYKFFKSRNHDVPLIIVSSGSHPKEGDSIATQAIAKHLIQDSCQLLEKADIILIPVLNPDGFVNGLNGCNSKGINFFWDFQNKNPQKCPEAYHFWEFLKEFPPNIYIDFHAYSTQGPEKQFGPYLKPSVLYCGTSTKRSATKLADILQTIPGSKSQFMFAPSSMPYKISKEFNSITFAKYHLHQDMGKQGMEKNALTVLSEIINSLEADELKHQILKPYGSLRKSYCAKIKQHLYINRHYLLKKLKHMYSSKKL